jgi:regulation of enolase protein 1 (concanavalin A-like superfamily)
MNALSKCAWLNEPPKWRLAQDELSVVTGQATDFWRQTHYGFTRHSGHLFGYQTAGDFTATVRVRARFESLYDQAGVMVHLDAKNWVKAGLEFSDGEAMLSSVVTLGQSDWATGSFGGDPGDFSIRATVEQGTLKLQASVDGERWPLLRLSPFPRATSYLVGPMCCTPERAGLEVSFSNFQVSLPNSKGLHDLTF